MTDPDSQITAAARDADARALKILNEHLWHFTSVGLGNCRAAQRVRQEIEQLRTAAVPGRSKVPMPAIENSSSRYSKRAAAPRNGRCPPQFVLANQTIEQLTAGLAHLGSVGLANSRAAEINRRELRRRIAPYSELPTLNHLRLANANFNPNEPRDQHGRWTEEGDTTGSATNKLDQYKTRLAIETPASRPSTKTANNPNQYITKLSSSLATTSETNGPGQANNPYAIAIPLKPSTVSCIAGGKPLELAPPPDSQDIRDALINFWNSISKPLLPELLPSSPEMQPPPEKPMPPDSIVSTPGGVMIVRDPGPNPLLPRPPKPTVAAGVLNGLGDLVRGFTSPIGIATLGMGALPRTAQRVIALLFAGQMLKQTPDLAQELGAEFGKPPEQRDNQKIAQLITTGAGSLGFGALAAAHGLKPTPRPTTETPPEPSEIKSAANPRPETQSANPDNSAVGTAARSARESTPTQTKEVTAGSEVKGGEIPSLRGNVPDPVKWIKNGGKVFWAPDGFTYTLPNGISVKYDNFGFPDFSPYLYKGSDGLNQVRITLTGNRYLDVRAANAKAGFKETPAGYIWHHNEELGLMQLVDEDIHTAFYHTGGFSIGNQ